MSALAAAEYAAGLTPREDQVLGLIGLGLTNRQIGDRLGIAEKTVKNTVTAVLSKLGFQRRGQAIIYVTVRRMSADQQADAGRTGGRPGAR
jgi:two-component system response regulator DevR